MKSFWEFIGRFEMSKMLWGIVLGIALTIVLATVVIFTPNFAKDRIVNYLIASVPKTESEYPIKTNIFEAENNYKIVAANIGESKGEILVKYLQRTYPHDYAESYVDQETGSVVIKEGKAATYEDINEKLLDANHHLAMAYSAEELKFGSYYEQEKKGAVAHITNSYLEEPIEISARIPDKYYNYIKNLD